MALNLSNEAPLPPATLIYGPNGVGKTTFLSMAEKPVMIDIEGGKGALNVASFPRATSWEMVRAQLGELCTEEHEFKTLGIDTIDWLETLFWDRKSTTFRMAKVMAWR
jgi:ABC-type branched-subunit amino acid transport system ATPase component